MLITKFPSPDYFNGLYFHRSSVNFVCSGYPPDFFGRLLHLIFIFIGVQVTLFEAKSRKKLLNKSMAIPISKICNLKSKILTFALQTALSPRFIGEESPDTTEKHSG